MGTQARPGDPLRFPNPGPFVGKTKLWLRKGRGGVTEGMKFLQQLGEEGTKDLPSHVLSPFKREGC